MRSVLPRTATPPRRRAHSATSPAKRAVATVTPIRRFRARERRILIAMILSLCLFGFVFVRTILHRAADTLASTDAEPWAQDEP